MKARSLVIALLLVISVALTILASRTLSENASIVLESRHIHNASLHVITADLNSPRLRVEIGLAAKGIAHSESFVSMVRRRSPVAAVTGTYFDTRTLFPVGSIVISGKTAHESAIGATVCFVRAGSIVCASDKAPADLAEPGGYLAKIARTGKGEKFNWEGVETGLRAGPLLLQDGAYALNPSREGFHHPGLFGRRVRMALGLTPANKLLLAAVETPVTFGQLAGIMKSLGATDALALDGGTSSAMYFRGRFVVYPGRALTNVVEVFDTYLSPARRLAIHTAGTLPGPLTRWTASRPAMAQAAGPAATIMVNRRSALSPSLSFLVSEQYQYAVLPEPPGLGLSKGRQALFPVHRTKLAGLKRLDYSGHFVYIAADVQVARHLVA